jgi:holo-[acyl-carrier protein] synthase
MIIGIGIDITAIEKIEESLRSDAFRRKVFSPVELETVREYRNKAEHLTGKFAAKEAFMKALGAGIRQEVWFSQIDVLNEESGKPFLKVSGEAAKRLKTSGATNVHVSISHSGGMAVAVVILEG